MHSTYVSKPIQGGGIMCSKSLTLTTSSSMQYISDSSDSFSPLFYDPLPPPPLLVNNHNMLTYAKTGNSKPKPFLVHSEAFTTKQALSNPDLFKAMQIEFRSLLANETWTLATLPPQR